MIMINSSRNTPKGNFSREFDKEVRFENDKIDGGGRPRFDLSLWSMKLTANEE